MLLSLVLLSACNPSKVPEDAIWYTITVTGIGPDECHPGNTEGYQDAFDYAIGFTGSRADVYVDGEPFASGTINGCNLTYHTVVYGTTTDAGELKWELNGQAQLDPGNDSCVEGDGDWMGTETFTIVDTDIDDMDVPCDYPMSTTGTYVPPEG